MVIIHLWIYLAIAGTLFNYIIFRVLKYKDFKEFWGDSSWESPSSNPGWYLGALFWPITVPMYFTLILSAKLFKNKDNEETQKD